MSQQHTSYFIKLYNTVYYIMWKTLISSHPVNLFLIKKWKIEGLGSSEVHFAQN